MDPQETEARDSRDTARLFSGLPSPEPREYASTFVGRSLGEYRVVRVVGHGSMGIVFEAEHVRLRRTVALKILPPSLSVTETVVRRFLREAQSVAKLDHESIVRIYDIGDQDGVHFYAMQYVRGQPLDQALRERRLSPRECARIAATAARALYFAHENGIIHRDVKPANIILAAKDRPVLTDFGLARPEKSGSLTESGALVGTPIYMSPEQVRGDKTRIDRRSDIYSLGITLYEMLTGKVPFEAESTQEILHKIEHEDPVPVRRLRGDVPKPLETICHKAIEKNPAERYQTAIEFALDLERFLSGEPVQARPISWRVRALRRLRRHRAVAWLALALLLAIGAIGVSVWRGSKSREQTRILQEQQARAEADRREAMFDRLVAEGRRRFEERDYVAALGIFDDAVALFPERAVAYVERGRCHYQLESPDAALLDFDRAIGLDPGDPRARLWRAITLCMWGTREQNRKGIEELKATLDAVPEDPECLLEATRLCLEIARSGYSLIARDVLINSSFERVRQLLEILRRRNTAALAEAEAAAAAEGVTLLEADRQRILDRDIDDALVLQGQLYEEQGLFDLARENYRQATEIDKGNVLAWTLLSRERPEDPAGEASEAAPGPTLTPSTWWAVLWREGLAWSREMKWDAELSRQLGAAMRAFPRGGRVPDALSSVQVDDVESLLMEAGVRWQEDERSAAVELYRRVLEIDDSLAEPNIRLLQYYLEDARDLTLAREYAERARAIAPANPLVLYLSLRVYSLQRDSERMKEIWTTIEHYYPALLTLPGLPSSNQGNPDGS